MGTADVRRSRGLAGGLHDCKKKRKLLKVALLAALVIVVFFFPLRRRCLLPKQQTCIQWSLLAGTL